MIDLDTYLTTQNTAGGPIIKVVESPVLYGSHEGNDNYELTTGALIGKAISLILMLAILGYFCIVR